MRRVAATPGRTSTQWLLRDFRQPHAVLRGLDRWQLAGGSDITIRVVRAGDTTRMQALMRALSVKSRYNRFFYPLRELPPAMLANFSRAEPEQAITLLAMVNRDGDEVAVGMAQYVAQPGGSCEFAVVVADAWQGNGIATRLVQALMNIARAAGIERMQGDILADNQPMRALLKKMNFFIGPHPDGGTMRIASIRLRQPVLQ